MTFSCEDSSRISVSSGLEEAHGKLQILARNGPMVASHGSVSLVQKERATGPQGHRARAAAVGSMGFSNHGVRPVEHPVNGKHGQLDVCFSYFCWETHGGELGVEHGLKT
jgi:hypothetical protein